MSHQEFWDTLVAAIGLGITIVGAAWTARSVILRPEDAVRIGVPVWAGTEEENLRSPMVQNLLAASDGAIVGLICLIGGAALQVAPMLMKLVGI